MPGEKKKLYLSVVLDLYDRHPVAHVVSSRNDNRLVFKRFDKAIAARPAARLIFHSDWKFQYTNRVYRENFERQRMRQSMFGVGYCIDNDQWKGSGELSK